MPLLANADAADTTRVRRLGALTSAAACLRHACGVPKAVCSALCLFCAQVETCSHFGLLSDAAKPYAKQAPAIDLDPGTVRCLNPLLLGSFAVRTRACARKFSARRAAGARAGVLLRAAPWEKMLGLTVLVPVYARIFATPRALAGAAASYGAVGGAGARGPGPSRGSAAALARQALARLHAARAGLVQRGGARRSGMAAGRR